MQAYIKTYGCTLNRADSDIIRSVMESGGVGMADSESSADVIVVNSCTVKKPTEQRILDLLKGFEKENRKVIVTGCMAGANPDLLEKYAPSASIVSTGRIHRIADVAREVEAGARVVEAGYGDGSRLGLLTPGGGVVARVPVSDGCLSSCSFCETKVARGPLSSFPEELIVKAVAASVARGAKEVQLTSQDIGAYGADRKTNIAELMSSLAGVEGDFMVRVGMLNPEHLHRYMDEFIEELRGSRFYKFVHLPVQSGSDAMLRSMGRHYTAEGYLEQVDEIRRKVPGVSIETDVIVGYPAETEADFDMTVDMITELEPDVTNVSRFWRRPHASASKMPGLGDGVIASRSGRLSRLVRKMQRERNCSLIGTALGVLITEAGGTSANGRSNSYKQVVIKDSSVELGSYIKAVVKDATANALYAEIQDGCV